MRKERVLVAANPAASVATTVAVTLPPTGCRAERSKEKFSRELVFAAPVTLRVMALEDTLICACKLAAPLLSRQSTPRTNSPSEIRESAAGAAIAAIGADPSLTSISRMRSPVSAPLLSFAVARTRSFDPGRAVAGTMPCKVSGAPELVCRATVAAPVTAARRSAIALSSSASTRRLKELPLGTAPSAGLMRTNRMVGGSLARTVRVNWANGPSLPKRSMAMARTV